MTGFSADWLALREPFDRAAREGTWASFDLPTHAACWRATQPSVGAPGASLAVIDLACGSGANLRALAPRIGGPQRWRLIDHDAALLAVMPQAMAQWAHRSGYKIATGPGPDAALRIDGPGFSAEVTGECLDLTQILRDEGDDSEALDFGRAHLVTASALLDLVSADWLDALLGKVCQSDAALLFALSVDGRTVWTPADEDDDTVHRLFSQHQRRDKGFGPALGSAAVSHACQRLAAAGYETLVVQSDWAINNADNDERAPAMLRAMIDGMASAAMEQGLSAANAIQAWKARRLAAVLGVPDAPGSRLTVGHLDVMAQPSRSTTPDPTVGRAPSGAR